MERTPRPQDITWFLDLNKNGQLDLDPPYQRKSVWTRGDKQFFLDTIFHNYPAPAVFLHKSTSDEGVTVYHVVDGKQRLTTILEFVDDGLAIPKEFGDKRLAGKKWSELDTDAKKAFWNYVLTVELLPDIEEPIVNAVFERINRNARKLSSQELRHAKFDGWLISRAEAEAEKQEWRDFGVVTTARAKRMNDVQFISEIILMTIRREIAGFDQDALDRAYAEFDVPSETAPTFNEEEFNAAFEAIKRFLMHMDDENGSVSRYGRTLAHFHSLWAYALLNKPNNATPAETAKGYEAFMSEVLVALEASSPPPLGESATWTRAVLDYAANVRGANTDTTPRVERLRALTSAMTMDKAA